MFNVDIATYHKQCAKRTLSQAFADERACAVEIHRPIPNTLRDVLLAVAIGMVIASALVEWWSA